MWYMNADAEVNPEMAIADQERADSITDLATSLEKEAPIKADDIPSITISPEVFLSDDHIINSQGSTVSEGENTNLNVQPHPEATKQGRNKGMVQQEKKRSERLKKDIASSTQEKVEMMAKKRNLEGTTKSQSMFSELSHYAFSCISKKMGIQLNDGNDKSFDILKELEIARANLFQKQNQLNSKVIIEEINEEDEDTTLQLEWVHEESSDPDESFFAQSRKKKKGTRKANRITL